MQLDAEQLIDVLAEKIGATDEGTVVVGIHSGGAWIAERLATKLGRPLGGNIAVTLHRDDFAHRGLHPQKQSTALDFSVDGSDVLLVDDVLESGRTVRAALNELFDFGRPKRVRLAVLIDRAGRELPIEAQWVAMTLPLDPNQALDLTRTDGHLRFEILPR
jgi:pyrimidine operon attenuation protein / uracil phosphoribosyltransferase